MKPIKSTIIFILILLFFQICFSARVDILEFEIINNKIKIKFALREVANDELIKVIFSGKHVSILYKVGIYQKMGFLRSDKQVGNEYVSAAVIKFDSFSNVITITYNHNNEISTKRLIAPRIKSPNDLIKAIQTIIKNFFNKDYAFQIQISNLNRAAESYYIKIIAKIASIKLAPPYDMINPSFNFTIEERKQF